MARMIFVNLPVADLVAATRFYEAIGCRRNEQFSSDQAASMVWSDSIYFQLLTRDYFQTFTDMPLGKAHETCSALYALSFDSRDAVDSVVEAGTAAGGSTQGLPVRDMGFMYNRQLQDPDGNILEIFWMDMAAMPGEDAA